MKPSSIREAASLLYANMPPGIVRNEGCEHSGIGRRYIIGAHGEWISGRLIINSNFNLLYYGKRT